MPFEVRERWSEYPSPSFLISLELPLGYFWSLSPLFTQFSLQHFGFSFCSQAGLTSLSLSLLSSPISFSPWLVLSSRRTWRLLWEGAAPGHLCCGADPLLRWNLCRKTSASPARGEGRAQMIKSLFQFHLCISWNTWGYFSIAALSGLTPPVNLVMEILAGLCVSFSFCP